MFLHRCLPCGAAHIGRSEAPRQCGAKAAAGVQDRIATVDLSPVFKQDKAGSLQAAKQLSAAFADTGFAIVTGTGVSAETIAHVRKMAYTYFGQDQAVKNEANEGCADGYGHKPYCYLEENGAQLLGDFSKPKDIVESLTYRGLEKEEVQAKLPKKPPGLGESVVRFNDGLSELRAALERTCELALALPEGYLAERCVGGLESLRLAYYPDAKNVLEGQMRYGAHVDSYGLTILSLDPGNPGGLQVDIDGSWVDVPYVEGSFVLNVGAMLSRWTNGRWKASVHRVLCRPGPRLSLVSGALRPRDDVLIESFASCGAAAYPPVLASDFFAERIAMHRPSYLEEKGLQNQETDGIADAIRNYKI
eukprot:TRINITY_DN71411_c0_g1_i1.p1 TRINITY_DN71411_c0_g1~~TRINITY_DN71411_c0_g1_i1.p1  ORF type:complete len:388 (+),score=101.60 TRINITY_DN71411_c0_g1_i1:79-1164(+)